MMNVTSRMGFVPWFFALAACGDDPAGAPDAAPLVADAAQTPDASGADAGAATNPKRLWLHGINGSESNLELIPEGPPSPF